MPLDSTSISETPFTISIRRQNSLAVVALGGELDMATGVRIRHHLSMFTVPIRSAVFDLSSVTFIDSSGLEAVRFAINDRGTNVSIRNPSRWVMRILNLLDWNDLIEDRKRKLTLRLVGWPRRHQVLSSRHT